jgi:hypothetical protein
MESPYLLKRRLQAMGLANDEPVKKEQKPITKKSEKQKDLEKEYEKKRKKYLRKHPFCESNSLIPGCQKVSMHVHHMRGRLEYLLDESTYRALCDHCHVHVEANPATAKKLKLSASRLSLNPFPKKK